MQMNETDKHQLLAEFARCESETAFATIVSQHVNLVYSTALRFTNNPHHAEEVTQAVFIILARKAGTFSPRVVLSGWLYQTTRLTAANFMRGELRRQQREQEAYMQSTLNEPETLAWAQIAPLLDEAMGRLGETDRAAVVLRFFENKTAAEVAATLGTTEAAAHKRVNRALEKLRQLFYKRGVMLTASLIGGTVAANSVQAAPAGMAQAISTVALAKGAAAGGSTFALAKGVLKLMAWTKAKMAIAVGAGVLLATGTTTVVVKEIWGHQTYPWQLAENRARVLDWKPSQVRIVPALKQQAAGEWTGDANRIAGFGHSAMSLVLFVYGANPTRTVVAPGVAWPDGSYDFIANFPQDSRPAMKEEIKRKFRVTARRETRETDVLLMIFKKGNPPGLKPTKRNDWSFSSHSGQGHYSNDNQSLAQFSEFLESHYKIPVIDRTGLTGGFDIDLRWDEKLDDKAFKQALLDQLGLELIPGREPVEMLVVEKVEK